MDRYSQLFLRLNKTNQGAFIPFVILGDPDPQLSLEIIDALIAGGADALELGIPFSDPLADGPTIQDAILRAFNAGITVASCFDLLAKIRQRHPQIPVGLLMYANLVFSQGIDAFYARCAAAGVDSVLIADVPLEESQPFRQAAQHHNIAPVFICPPNASNELLKNIAAWGKGYTYLLSRAGVTGTENRGVKPLHQLIEKLKFCGAPPALQGFGISTPGQVKTVLAAGAEGAISGSAIVKIIEQFRHQPETLVLKLTQFISEMKSATQRDKVSINITTS